MDFLDCTPVFYSCFYIHRTVSLLLTAFGCFVFGLHKPAQLNRILTFRQNQCLVTRGAVLDVLLCLCGTRSILLHGQSFIFIFLVMSFIDGDC